MNNDALTTSKSDVTAILGDSGGPLPSFHRVSDGNRMLGEVDPNHACQELTSAYRRHSLTRAHKGVDRSARVAWALDTKSRANQLYREGKLEEAQQLYVDCLSAMDGSPEMKSKILVPISANLAACMIELGHYAKCVKLCSTCIEAVGSSAPDVCGEGRVACSVFPSSYVVGDVWQSGILTFNAMVSRTVSARGIAYYRLGDYDRARSDLERVPHEMPDVSRYLRAIKRKQRDERKLCNKMLKSEEIYPDKAVKRRSEKLDFDDLFTDESPLGVAAEGSSVVSWLLSCCRRRRRP
ncbi:hypothetical protein FOZ60_014522 [Perkinsus olseni]|uniref:Uncharacterized protein n=1 Tax=Perkinsus olseni TaxID=32597 RepID=A0A7J6P753_PEROL|nr:hypothetical protein FOZ60_014522 [Perkinsus olseni]